MSMVRVPDGRYLLVPTTEGRVTLSCMDETCRDSPIRERVYESDEALDFELWTEAMHLHEQRYHVGPNSRPLT